MERVKAFAPATVANLGVGFDVLGMAVSNVGDYVTVEERDEEGVELIQVSGDDGRLPTDVTKNSATIAAQEVLNAVKPGYGVRLWLDKKLPLSSGLGSSSASAVAAAVATNEILGEPLSREDLLPCVLAAEEAVSARHADNVAPSLFGGLVLITGMSAAEIHRLPLPTGVYVSLVTPEIEINTAQARQVLPQMVPLSVMVHQTAIVAEIVHAVHSSNIHLLARTMQRDTVVEPAREGLVPHFEQAKEAASLAGALVTVISGSGPTLCSLCVTSQDCEAVSHAVVKVYADAGISTTVHNTTPCVDGAYIVR